MLIMCNMCALALYNNDFKIEPNVAALNATIILYRALFGQSSGVWTVVLTTSLRTRCNDPVH